MKFKSILIFGTGSFANKHAEILKKIYKKIDIYFFSERKKKKYLKFFRVMKNLELFLKMEKLMKTGVSFVTSLFQIRTWLKIL